MFQIARKCSVIVYRKQWSIAFLFSMSTETLDGSNFRSIDSIIDRI
jgi:hypothetical protein